jgi:hypothetical protein
MSISRALAAGLAACLLVTGCGGDEPEAAPVATPTVTLDHQQVPIGSPLKVTYRFVVAPDAHFDKNYTVFVHVLDSDAQSLWGDDHQPPTPTSQWQPGQTIEYTRTLFVPNYPYIGPASVRVGLYDPDTGKRLTLGGVEGMRQEYEVATLELQPQSENIFLIFKDGWYQGEVARDNPTVEWQWTSGRATLSFRNPRKAGTLFLEYSARPDQFTSPQQVTLRIGDAAIGSFAAEARAPTLLTFPVAAEQFGADDVSEIVIEVDRTFAPGNGDTRELGIQVFHVFVDAR